MCKLRQRQPRAAISGYTRRLRTQDRAISKPGSPRFPDAAPPAPWCQPRATARNWS